MASETLSELSKDDIDFLLEKEIVWEKVKLKNWDTIYLGDSFQLKENDHNLIVIDITKEPFTKQFCTLSKDGKINKVDIMTYKRNIAHRRCKTPIIIKGGSLFCPKCSHIVPSKDTHRWSYLENKFLRTENIFIGEAMIDDAENQIILIDLEYPRRRNHIFSVKDI